MAKFFEVDPKNFRFFKYSNGRLAIRQLSQDGDPVATLTVNLPDLELEEGEVFIKSYSENEGLLEDLKELGLVEVVDTVISEYVTIPKCRWLGKTSNHDHDLIFQEKVKSMTFKEIVMAMVNGLRKRHVEVEMNTFGAVKFRSELVSQKYYELMPDGYLESSEVVCIGCAATNAVCEISGHVFNPKEIITTRKRADAIQSEKDFLSDFEIAINCLRQCDIAGYNEFARKIEIKEAPTGYICGPPITNHLLYLDIWEESVKNL